MIIFVTARRADKYFTLAIPEHQIYSIFQQANLIQIRYNNGEMEVLGVEEATAQGTPRTETITVKSDTVDEAVELMKSSLKKRVPTTSSIRVPLNWNK